MANSHQQNLLEIKALVDPLPLLKRIELYRFLASVADNRKMTHELLNLAEQLEAAEKLCQEFDFKFSHDHKMKGDGK